MSTTKHQSNGARFKEDCLTLTQVRQTEIGTGAFQDYKLDRQRLAQELSKTTS